jgi:glycosyltransferase involved in cell wall biosynthesis
MKIDLTIAIPTYNRSELLDKKLEQLFALDENIYILVSDNSSTDQTKYIGEKYSSYKNFKFNSNEVNLGYDANVLKCFDLSETEYIWILSDDDDFYDFSIRAILDYISNKPDLICLNDETSGRLNLTEINTSINKNVSLPLGEVIQLSELSEDDKFAYVVSFFWLSRLVFRKNKVLNIESLPKYIGSHFIQLAIVNNIMKNNLISIIYTKEALIKNNPHVVFTHNFTDVFVNKFYDFCMIPESNLSKKFALKVARDNIPFVVNGLLLHKIGRAIFKYDFRFWYLLGKMLKYKCSVLLIIKFVIVKICPTFLIQMIKKSSSQVNEVNEKKTFI